MFVCFDGIILTPLVMAFSVDFFAHPLRSMAQWLRYSHTYQVIAGSSTTGMLSFHLQTYPLKCFVTTLQIKK